MLLQTAGVGESRLAGEWTLTVHGLSWAGMNGHGLALWPVMTYHDLHLIAVMISREVIKGRDMTCHCRDQSWTVVTRLWPVSHFNSSHDFCRPTTLQCWLLGAVNVLGRREGVRLGHGCAAAGQPSTVVSLTLTKALTLTRNPDSTIPSGQVRF